MYTIEWKKEIPAFVLLAVVLLVVGLMYPALPERLPMHWNIQGEVDGWVAKSWGSVFWMPLMCVAMHFLMLFLPLIDPRKERYAQFLRPYRQIRYGLVIYLSLVSILVLVAAIIPAIPVHYIIAGTVSLLMIVIGNYLGKLRPNWFVGIRLPWTLENEEVWIRTHRLGGKLFVLVGIMGLIGLFFKPVVTFALFFGSLLVTLVIVVVYAFQLYRKLSG